MLQLPTLRFLDLLSTTQLCSVMYGPSITDVCLFFFFLPFHFVPRKTKVPPVPSKLDCLAICYQQSHKYETLPHLDFVPGKPLSILIPTWAQPNSQAHLDLGMWLQQNNIIIINDQPLVNISCVIFIGGNSASLCLGIGLGLERLPINSLSCHSVPAWCLFLMLLGLLLVEGNSPALWETPSDMAMML